MFAPYISLSTNKFSIFSRIVLAWKQQVAFESNFKGVRAMNLSDLYDLFNCVRAGSVGGTNHYEENFIRIARRRSESSTEIIIKNVRVLTFVFLHVTSGKRVT